MSGFTMKRNSPNVKPTKMCDTKTDDQTLPPKDLALFQNLMKFSEEKVYNRALKIANDILKRHPNHGETLSMKAMILSYTNADKEQYFSLAKQGVKANISSSTCWQILGILNRTEKNYSEALRYFRQAHRLTPDSLLLLRDLATLQTHERDLTGLLESRKKTILLRPNLRLYWIAYTLANHLVGNYHVALYLTGKILKLFPSTHDRYASTREDRQITYDDGELYLYQALISEEMGLFDQAIDFLETCTKIPDAINRLEALGRLYIYTKNYEKAHTTFSTLCDMCPSNRRYLLCSFATDPHIVSKVIFPPIPSSKQEKDNLKFYDQTISNDHVLPKTENFLLQLSPYTLRSPQLISVDSPGWCVHPPHLLYSQESISSHSITNTSQEFPTCCPAKTVTLNNVLFRQLRSMLEEEEILLMTWIFKDLSKEKNPPTDSALFLALEMISSKERFCYLIDFFLRKKIFKSSASVSQIIQKSLIHSQKGNDIIELLEKYVECTKRCIVELQETGQSTLSVPLGPSPEKPKELEPFSNSTPYNEPLDSLTIQAIYLITTANLAAAYDRRGWSLKALPIIKECIEHTPSLMDLYLIQGKILKNLGCFKEAADCCVKAHQMDQSDRFTSTVTLKYCLKAGNLDLAESLAVYYTSDKKKENLIEMQSMRYQLLYGEAALYDGKEAVAMKNFYDIVNHFKVMRDDQFDFHLYSLHTGTLNHYIRFLRMENRIHANKFYRFAAAHVIKGLLKQHQQTLETEKQVASCVNVPTPLSQENKKKKKNKPAVCDVKKNEQIEGEKILFANGQPLQKAWQLATKLYYEAQLDPVTHQLVFCIACYKDQVLLMCQSLYRSWILSNYDWFNSSFSPIFCDFLCYNLCHNCFQSEPVQTESTNHSDTLKAKSCDNFLNKAVLFLLQVISQHLPLQKSNLKQQLSETPHIHLHLIETILLDYIDLLVNTSFNPDQILIVLRCLCTVERHCPSLVQNASSLQSILLERLTTFLKQSSSSLDFKSCYHLYRELKQESHPLNIPVKNILQEFFPTASCIKGE